MAREVAVPAEWELRAERRRYGPLRVLLALRHHPLGVFGLVVIFVLVVTAIGAPLIAPYDPETAPSQTKVLQPPTLDHVFGTDRLGRDVFSRVVFGARLTLEVGLVSVLFGVFGATALGLASGYLGGRVDSIIQRTVDVALAFPALILLLAIMSVLGNPDSGPRQFVIDHTPLSESKNINIGILTVAIGIGMMAGVTRIVRGAVLSEKQNVYVEAARALGATDLRIMAGHVLPNIMALIIVLVSILLPVAILAEASLSFLGLGVPPPAPSWGADLSAARSWLEEAPWWTIFPGTAISLTVLGFNLLGDALRDILDPRLRGRGLS
ncbi:MAG: ABC transporter permease [Chloroflexota bacterium]|nr:ABC transporter permease [Chloroflexota bacterium]